MELYDDLHAPCEGMMPRIHAPASVALRFCEAKGKICLTGCAYCKNTCPCVLKKQEGLYRNE